MYKAGITYEQFGKLNMKQIRIIANAYAEKAKEDFKMADLMAYIQGRYMVDALLATVGNMFGGKNANFQYPEKPYSLAREETELTEEEIEQQRQEFIASLQTMERNFRLSKSKKEQEKNA